MIATVYSDCIKSAIIMNSYMPDIRRNSGFQGMDFVGNGKISGFMAWNDPRKTQQQIADEFGVNEKTVDRLKSMLRDIFANIANFSVDELFAADLDFLSDYHSFEPMIYNIWNQQSGDGELLKEQELKPGNPQWSHDATIEKPKLSDIGINKGETDKTIMSHDATLSTKQSHDVTVYVILLGGRTMLPPSDIPKLSDIGMDVCLSGYS
jgi:hypothetical protein